MIKKARLIVVELELDPRQSDSKAYLLNYSLYCLSRVKTGRKLSIPASHGWKGIWRICSLSIPSDISN
jgi:hypothetical protein